MSDLTYRRSRQRREVRLTVIAGLLKNGWSIRRVRSEVMRELGLRSYSINTCWRDINLLLKEWREDRLEETEKALQLELERIDQAIVELWEQWERSKQDYQRHTTKQKAIPGKKGGQAAAVQMTQIERITTEVVQLGNPAYISEIRMQLIERRKLLGLYAPKKREITGKDGAPLYTPSVNTDSLTDDERQILLRIARANDHEIMK